MTNAADECARQLLALAANGDSPEIRHKIDACLDEYLAQGGRRLPLSDAFELGEIPNTPLTAFIRARLATETG